MELDYTITLSERAQELLKSKGIPDRLARSMMAAMDRENALTVARVKDYLSVRATSKRGRKESMDRNYDLPHQVTGRLRSSIGRTRSVFVRDAGSVVSVIGSGVGEGSEAVRYAAIQEYGGTALIPSRPRKNFKAPTGKKMTYRGAAASPMTKAYSVRIPARPFLTRTVEERIDDYSTALSMAVENYWGADV